jgi:hypothetical protein
MSEQKTGRWIVKWDTGDGSPYFAGYRRKIKQWARTREEAHVFAVLGEARNEVLFMGLRAKVYRLVRRVPS